MKKLLHMARVLAATATALAGIILMGGCDNASSSQTQSSVHAASLLPVPAPQELVGEGGGGATTTQAMPRLKNIFVLEANQPEDVRNAVERISILATIKVFAEFQGFEVGRRYKAAIRLYDTVGDEVDKQQADFFFVPEATSWNLYRQVALNHRVRKGGIWVWEVSVDGVGTFKKEFEVLPPTKAQLEDIARREQAQDNAWIAFAHFWQGMDGAFTTEIVTRRTTVEWVDGPIVEVVDNSANRGVLLPQNRVPPTIRRENVKTQKTNTTETSVFLQVRKLVPQLTPHAISDADVLNGIRYRGQFAIGFGVYRAFLPEVGWTEWRDTIIPQQNVLAEAFAATLRDVFGAFGNLADSMGVGGVGMPARPQGLPGAVNLVFDIVQRDNRWFVKTGHGDLFVDGKLARLEPAILASFTRRDESTTPILSTTPLPAATTRPAGEMICRAPRLAEVKRLTEEGRTPSRDIEFSLEMRARQEPEALRNDIETTMANLKQIAR